MKRGIPNVLMDLDNRAKKINPRLLPPAEMAAEQYRTDLGGTISEPCYFGTDPLQSNTKKALRDQSFCAQYSFKLLFCDVSNGCGSSFRSALKFFIGISYRMANSS